MKGELPDGWELCGLWNDSNYREGSDYDDDDIGDADAIVVRFQDTDWDHWEYMTVHGADDWEALSDLIDDVDTDSYFG